jgi:hypothetical protein
MSKLRIFVGSSTEQKGVAESCAVAIEEAGHTAVCWWRRALPPGRPLLQELRRIAQQVDGAIFIFGEDDKVWFRNAEPGLGQPRDNVLIEYGLFIGSSHDKPDGWVIHCCVGQPKTASDLGGITGITYDPERENKFEQDIKSWLSKLTPSSSGDSSLTMQVQTRADESLTRNGAPSISWLTKLSPSSGDAKDMSKIFSSHTKEAQFRAGELLIKSAPPSIFLCAKTPIPIVGARPYHGIGNSEQYEIDQLAAYENFLQRVETTESKLTIVACLGSIHQDLRVIDLAVFTARVRERVSKLFDARSRCNGRLELRWYDGTGLVTFLATEDQSIIWFKKERMTVEDDVKYVWIETKGKTVPSALISSAIQHTKRLDLDEVLSRLDLNSKRGSRRAK